MVNIQIKRFTVSAFIALGLLFSNCKKAEEAQAIVSDADQTVALRNVTITYDSLHYVIGLPPNALSSGKTFQQLRKEDSVTYTNPENYSVTLSPTMLADNTKPAAADAAFDGMTLNTVMNALTATPVQTVANAFMVTKGTTLPVQATGKLNLKTHRLVGLYIFQQVVAGQPLSTDFSPILNYKFGSTVGTIPLPTPIHANIPTRADDQTKAFLQGLIQSGVFNQ